MTPAVEQEKEQSGFWGILELMGHVRLGGYITEETKFGTVLGRIDIPGETETFTTQYFGGSSIYRLTPTTEVIARSMASGNQPKPVHAWELPQLQAASQRQPLDQPDHSDLDGIDDDDDHYARYR